MGRGERRRTVRLHVTLLAGLVLCSVGFTLELRRALAGHVIAWAYVLEWPVFAAVGAHFWWRLWRAPDGEGDELGAAASPAHALAGADGAVEEVHDAELAAWQAYVAGLDPDDDC